MYYYQIINQIIKSNNNVEQNGWASFTIPFVLQCMAENWYDEHYYPSTIYRVTPGEIQLAVPE